MKWSHEIRCEIHSIQSPFQHILGFPASESCYSSTGCLLPLSHFHVVVIMRNTSLTPFTLRFRPVHKFYQNLPWDLLGFLAVLSVHVEYSGPSFSTLIELAASLLSCAKFAGTVGTFTACCCKPLAYITLRIGGGKQLSPRFRTRAHFTAFNRETLVPE